MRPSSTDPRPSEDFLLARMIRFAGDRWAVVAHPRPSLGASVPPEVVKVRVPSSKVPAWFPPGSDLQVLPPDRFEELVKAVRGPAPGRRRPSAPPGPALGPLGFGDAFRSLRAGGRAFEHRRGRPGRPRAVVSRDRRARGRGEVGPGDGGGPARPSRSSPRALDRRARNGGCGPDPAPRAERSRWPCRKSMCLHSSSTCRRALCPRRPPGPGSAPNPELRPIGRPGGSRRPEARSTSGSATRPRTPTGPAARRLWLEGPRPGST